MVGSGRETRPIPVVTVGFSTAMNRFCPSLVWALVKSRGTPTIFGSLPLGLPNQPESYVLQNRVLLGDMVKEEKILVATGWFFRPLGDPKETNLFLWGLVF